MGRQPERADLPRGHVAQDHEKIEIAVRPRIAMRPRAKEDDLVNAAFERPEDALGELLGYGEVGRAEARGHRQNGTSLPSADPCLLTSVLEGCPIARMAILQAAERQPSGRFVVE